MQYTKDFFETYLDYFPNSPSLVLVRSVELKNFPREYLRDPILDLGCGDGFFSKCLGLDGIYGCDIDKIVIEKACEWGIYKKISLGDARSLLSLYQENYFGSVFSNCVLEHIDGLRDVLRSVNKVLSPNGYFIITVPSENLNKWFPVKLILQKLGFYKFGYQFQEIYNERQKHINILCLEDWRLILEDENFEVIRYYYLFSEREYKIAILLDSLLLLGKFIGFVLKLIPLRLKKFLLRKLMKSIYQNSKPLKNGGELVLVAKKSVGGIKE